MASLEEVSQHSLDEARREQRIAQHIPRPPASETAATNSGFEIQLVPREGSDARFQAAPSGPSAYDDSLTRQITRQPGRRATREQVFCRLQLFEQGSCR